MGIVAGCMWSLPEEEASAEPEAIAAAVRPVVQADVRTNPASLRAAILGAQARRRSAEEASEPSLPPSPALGPTSASGVGSDAPEDGEDAQGDPLAEALEDAFGPLEPGQRAVESCLSTVPAGARGVVSVRVAIIGEPSLGVVVDTVEILDDAGQPSTVDCIVEALFEADFPDRRDVVFDDYVFEANLAERRVTMVSGISSFSPPFPKWRRSSSRAHARRQRPGASWSRNWRPTRSEPGTSRRCYPVRPPIEDRS